MYTVENFRTKKELKAAVEAYNASLRDGDTSANYASPVTYFQPGPYGNAPRNGTVYLEGPHYPEPHRWYAQAVAKDGVIIKVK